MRVHHIGIWTEDMARAGEFCEHILGLQLEREYEASAEVMKAIFGLDEPCRIKVYARGEVKVELFDAGGSERSGMNHFACSVGDREEFCAQAREKGARVIEVWRGDHPVYFINGPTDVLIEIKD